MVSPAVSNPSERLVTHRVDNDDVELNEERPLVPRKSRLSVLTRRVVTVVGFLFLLLGAALVSYYLVDKYKNLMQFRHDLTVHVKKDFPTLDPLKRKEYFNELSSMFRQGLISQNAKLEFEVFLEFEKFNKKYNRVHTDETERQNKHVNFRRNYLDVKNQKGDEPYTKGLNRFSDMSDNEIYNMFPPIKVPERELLPTESDYKRIFSNDTYLKNLKAALKSDQDVDPKTVTGEGLDWRRPKSVSPVRDQMNCGACWAFASVASVESLYLSHRDVTYDLSPQELLDCDSFSNGCKGGFVDSALEYVRRHGLSSSKDMPFVDRANQCSVPAVKKVYVAGYYVFKGKQVLDKSLVMTPTAVYVAVSPELLRYEKGVYTGPCGYALNHALLLVGEDVDPETQKRYWVLKNSWGEDWGENGYVRLERTNLGTDKCSLLDTGFAPYLTLH